MSVDAMRKKIKALWQNSKSMFVRGEGETLSQIEEGTMSAVEEGGESEVSLRSAGGRECGEVWKYVLTRATIEACTTFWRTYLLN